MTIWLLALVLLASLAGLGYRQGAIRVGVSFIGIVFGAFLAWPLGKLLKPIFLGLGVKNPVWPYLLGPLLVFIIINILFKVGALTLHQKVDVHYKYKAGDLRLALWERLNARAGLCLGLLNATAYLVLIVGFVYPLCYWGYELGGNDQDPKWLKLLDRVGQDIQNTGFVKVAGALNHQPQSWYDSADLAGLLYRNPLLEARLARYPAYFSLAERPEFQDLANDKEFQSLRSRQDPIMSVLDYPKIQSMLGDPNVVTAIWDTTKPDLADLRTFLETGKSPKYDPIKILGHWGFNVRVALSMMVKAKPNINSIEMKKLKAAVLAAYSKTTFVAKPDHTATFKHLPQVKLTATGATAGGDTVACQWQEQDGKYTMNIAGTDMPVTVDGERLTVGAETQGLVFDRED